MPIGEDAPTDGYFMSVNANNVDGGKEFLAFLGSAEAQTVVVEELGRLAVNPDVDHGSVSPMQQKGIELIQGADLVVQFYDRDTTPEMADVGMNAMMAFWDDPYNEKLSTRFWPNWKPLARRFSLNNVSSLPRPTGPAPGRSFRCNILMEVI